MSMGVLPTLISSVQATVSVCVCCALPSKVPDWLDKLNTIIKIYSDAHVGLTSKWLVHSADRTHVPIREPEERRCTLGDTQSFSQTLAIFRSQTSAYSQCLELSHAQTSALPGTVRLASAENAETVEIKKGSEDETRERASVKERERSSIPNSSRCTQHSSEQRCFHQRHIFNTEPLFSFKNWNCTEPAKYSSNNILFYWKEHSFPILQIKATIEFKQTDLLSLFIFLEKAVSHLFPFKRQPTTKALYSKFKNSWEMRASGLDAVNVCLLMYM